MSKCPVYIYIYFFVVHCIYNEPLKHYYGIYIFYGHENTKTATKI